MLAPIMMTGLSVEAILMRGGKLETDHRPERKLSLRNLAATGHNFSMVGKALK